MQCSTHKLIAHKVYEIMFSEFGITFDYEELLNGSVAPDKKPYLIIIPHTLKQSFWLLKKQTHQLINSSLPVSYEHNKKNSFKMGIIIHLVSDYFCAAHNDVKYLNPITHYIYEKRLKHFFKKNINKLQIDFNKCRNEISGNINDYINKKHMEYLQSERNMRNDLIFSLESAVSFAVYIASTVLKEDGYKSGPHFGHPEFMTA